MLVPSGVPFGPFPSSDWLDEMIAVVSAYPSSSDTLLNVVEQRVVLGMIGGAGEVFPSGGSLYDGRTGADWQSHPAEIGYRRGAPPDDDPMGGGPPEPRPFGSLEPRTGGGTAAGLPDEELKRVTDFYNGGVLIAAASQDQPVRPSEDRYGSSGSHGKAIQMPDDGGSLAPPAVPAAPAPGAPAKPADPEWFGGFTAYVSQARGKFDSARSWIGPLFPFTNFQISIAEQNLDLAQQAGTVWKNTSDKGIVSRVYVTAATTIGTLTGVRGVDDAFHDHDAVDGHLQSTGERVGKGLLGSVQFGLIVYGIKAGGAKVLKPGGLRPGGGPASVTRKGSLADGGEFLDDATRFPEPAIKAGATNRAVSPRAVSPTPVVGPGSLTAQEATAIQKIADKYQVRVDVGGSRARGAGRNIEQPNLPADKGPGTRSDIDFIIDPNHPQFRNILSDLRQALGADDVVQLHPDFRLLVEQPVGGEPRLRFTPGAKPVFVEK